MTVCLLLGKTRNDASTGTSCGKLLPNNNAIDDEMYTYVELTEILLRIASEQKLLDLHERNNSLKNDRGLPMRRSLFPHVPPFIVFHTGSKQTLSSRLPDEIRRHLLWFHTRQYSPSVIRSIVLKSGFRMTLRSSSDWSGTWCGRLAYARLGRSKSFQKCNHFPNSAQLSNKILLWKNFRRMAARHGGVDFYYMPKSFVLPGESRRLRKWMKSVRDAWILKPANNCAGRGIRIISRWYEVPDEGKVLIAQRYLGRPMLIAGTKFDLRLYVLVTSVDPLRLYIHSEGLVRLATKKYSYDVRSLYDRFVHLTNTSVNKLSPWFKANDDPDNGNGHMWSLTAFWKYLISQGKVDIPKIWDKIKDISIKSLISAEASFVRSLKANPRSSYNCYQLYGFDVLLDEDLRPWLLEINDCPSLDLDTPLCGIIKGRLVSDYLNLVGFHVPDILSRRELIKLKGIYGDSTLCFDRNLYNFNVPEVEKKRRETFLGITKRQEYLEPILKNLSPNDVRTLIHHEDEIARTAGFERLFPTCNTHEYLKYFDEVRYNDMLLDAWETKYADNRSTGIARLRELCWKKYHLSRSN